MAQKAPEGDQAERLLRRRVILARLGVSRNTLARMVRRGDFPRPIKISKRAIGWYAGDVEHWFDVNRPADVE